MRILAVNRGHGRTSHEVRYVLADLTPVGSVRDVLKHLADADIEASLAHVSEARSREQPNAY